LQSNKPLAGIRILIAEDDAILGFDMACILRSAGAETLGPAKTLQEARRLAESAQVTCGVLDVSLGKETVFPAAQVLRDRHIGLVFYTGCSNPEALQHDWPEAQVLFKPASTRALLKAVTQVCSAADSCAEC